MSTDVVSFDPDNDGVPPHSTESLDQFSIHSFGVFKLPENLYLVIDPQSNTRQFELGFDDE